MGSRKPALEQQVTGVTLVLWRILRKYEQIVTTSEFLEYAPREKSERMTVRIGSLYDVVEERRGIDVAANNLELISLSFHCSFLHFMHYLPETPSSPRRRGG